MKFRQFPKRDEKRIEYDTSNKNRELKARIDFQIAISNLPQTSL